MFTACKSWRNIHCNERSQTNEEIENGKYALEVLGGELKEMSTFQLPFEESERNILLIEKKRKTPKKYPRKPGTPNKLPIEK